MKGLLLFLLIVLVFLIYWYFPSETLVTKEVSAAIPFGSQLKAGNFTSIDRDHQGQGQAYIIQNQEKMYLVLEQFKFSYSPQLYVYISPASAVQNEKDIKTYKEIGLLKGNAGNQVFEISSDTLWKYHSVAIWDKQSGRLFSSASLS